MKVTFLHPRESLTCEADVDPTTTGETCIRGLVGVDFIHEAPTGRPYTLVHTRTQRQVLPTTTMQEAGVNHGDSVAIQQMEQGA